MASTAESRDQSALRAVKAEAKDVTAELQTVLAGLLRNPDDVFLQNVKRRLEGHKEKLESRQQTLESVIAGKDNTAAPAAARALPPPAELTAQYERRVQQHPQPPKQAQAQQGRGATSSAPQPPSPSASPAPPPDAADVPLLFNWRVDRRQQPPGPATSAAKPRKAAAGPAPSSGSSGSSDAAGAAAAVAVGGLLLPQLAHPVFAHVLRLLEGGTAAAASAGSGTGVAEEDLVAAAGLIEAACGYGLADEAHLAAAVQDVLLPYLFGPSHPHTPAATPAVADGEAAAAAAAAVFVRHAVTLAPQRPAASASPFSPRAAPRWAVGDDATHPSHLLLLAEFRTGLGASGGGGSPTADPAFVGATRYLDFWQQQRQAQQAQGQQGQGRDVAGRDDSAWGLPTYRPAFLLEVLGPNLRLSALHWTDRPVLTPLTPLLPLLPLHDPELLQQQGPAAAAATAAAGDDDRLLLPVARLLSGLRSGLRWLAALNHRARRPATAVSPEPAQAPAAAAAAAPAKRRRVKTASAPTAEAAAGPAAAAAAPGAATALAIQATWPGPGSPNPALPYPVLLSRRYDTRAVPVQALGPRTFLITAAPAAAVAPSSGASTPTSASAPVPVVVRLARAYDLQAQREWAALGLAPRLLRSRRLRSGWVLAESEYLPLAAAAASSSSSSSEAGEVGAWQPLQQLLASAVEVERAGALAAVKAALQRGSAGGGPAAADAASRAADALGWEVTDAAGGWLVRRGAKRQGGAPEWEARLVDFRLPDPTSRRLRGLASALRAIEERKRAALQQQLQQLEEAAAAAAAVESAAAAAVESAAAEAAAASGLAAAAAAAAAGRKRGAARPAGSRGTASASSSRSTRSRDEAAAAVKDSGAAGATARRSSAATTAGESKGTVASARAAATKGAGARGPGGSGSSSGTGHSAGSSSAAGGAVVKGRSRRGSPPPPAAVLSAPPRPCVSAAVPAASWHLPRPRTSASQRATHLGARLRVLGW